MIVRCPPVREIPPIILTEEGQLVSVTGTAFVAGVLPLKVRVQDLSDIHSSHLNKCLVFTYPVVPVVMNFCSIEVF